MKTDSGKRVWRSVERPDDGSGRLPEELRPEFQPGADLPPGEMTRRTMMGLMGASIAMATMTGCRPVEHIVPYVDAPPGVVPGIPERYATTLPMGTSAVGVVVESHEGRPGKIEGNELHPASRGAASAWTQAQVLALYDPDRARRVSRRPMAAAPAPAAAAGADGEAADGPAPAAWEAATWEDFAATWRDELRTAHDETGGAGLAFLLEPSSSPTRERLLRRIERRFPQATIVAWSPLSEENVFAGTRQAAGRAVRPLPRFERARVIVTLDADPLMTEGEAVASARGLMEARGLVEAGENGGGMARLYAVESTPTVTGANADHRLRLQSRQVPAFVAALAGELGVASGLPAGELPEAAAARGAQIAEELRRAGSRALIVAGHRQPPAVHAAVHRINQALGAVGTTVEEVPLTDVRWSTTADLAALAEGLHAGRVDTLVVAGGNPVYAAPADLELGEALGKAKHVVRLSPYLDETAQAATWHLPETHPFEAWGDARSADGTRSVVQPLILPLFGGKSEIELLGLLAIDTETPGHDLVRETWGVLDGETSEERWRQILHDGVEVSVTAAAAGDAAASGSEPAEVAGEVPAPAPAATDAAPDPTAGAAAPAAAMAVTDEPAAAPAAAMAVTDEPAAAPAAATAVTDGWEVVITPSIAAHDGRYANLAWLQELPDPLTRLTWDNAALVSPADAERLGVELGDVVTLTAGPASIEAPVLVMPGQADGSIALAMGYGRTAAGRVGDGVGVDAAPLRTAAAPWIVGGVEVAPAGRRYELVRTQEHWSMEGRDLVREVAAAGAAHGANGHGANGHAEHADHDTPTRLWEPPELTGERQWGMTIDLASCTGCNACVVACQSENNVPVVGKEQVASHREMHWLRVDRYFTGSEDDPGVVFQPVPCQHCENAPCEQVCPVAATVHDAEGLNLMVYNRCIGTRYCSNNCPYKVRRFNFFNYTADTPELMKLAMNPDVTVRSRGVMEKCTYCNHRIQDAKIQAKRDGRELADGDVQTACQQTCPTRAIRFGDVSDPGSKVSEAKADPRNYVLLEELRNRPRTTYLARVRNPAEGWGAEA